MKFLPMPVIRTRQRWGAPIEEEAMNRRIGLSVTAFSLVVLWATAALALTTIKRTFDELVALSEFILIGTVTSVESTLDPERERIYTYVTLADLEVIKGELQDNAYVLRVSGGTVGDVSEIYAGMPRFEEGKRYIIFVRGNFHDIFPVVGIYQGVFQVAWDAQHQQEVVQTLRGEAVTSVSEGQLKGKQTISSPPEAEVTVDQFVQRIRERLRTFDSGRQGDPGDSESVRPPSPEEATP